MNRKIFRVAVLVFWTSVVCWSCEDYLDIIPKGKRVPKTLEDYAAFLQNPAFTVGGTYYKMYLVNESYQDPSYMVSSPLNQIHYYWLEDKDRISDYKNDEVYNGNYRAIFYMNLLINDVPGINVSSSAESIRAKVLIAQAKTIRALHYFYLVNTFAKAYNPETAASDGGIPYTTNSDDFEGQIAQESVEKIYGHILDDLNAAIPELPLEVDNFMEPNRAAGYALRARVHLFMHNWQEAFNDANEALKLNDYIFDMVAYHREYVDPDGTGRTIQDDRNAFTGLPRITYSLGKDENLLVKGGNSLVTSTEISIKLPLKDSVENQFCTRDPSRFGEGDTRFLCVFYRDEASGYYESRLRDNKNWGGLRTPEVYLIRAECNARLGFLDEAMDDLNALRKKRIIASVYQPLSASSLKEAIDYIRKERDVELLGSGMMFYDMRRFNTETEYQRTMVKKDDKGIMHSLKPDSELWVMPFPKSVTDQNTDLKQNTKI
ncbi:RagB/SusD family nutrient uptake outer membrane protein [Odoribacter sp. AF15-53]|uniref:RagB/SusD family nutrient uptake outer membrane protein n=1 Tax=Odoribacter sp. AF15-53 TaxID=2292236 RepID=UPI000E5169F8|nr:RagB/SusD family nutrient uptake outer membrane protein [Odoribacter sp. AF15-53]RHR76084.1 RagB/SusD family nutrient uptake outer membrane protein [Odoribacter sp. AF15-53]